MEPVEHSRTVWERAADDLLEGLLPFRLAGGALYALPGPRPSDNGLHVDAFEGFARSFLLAAFRLVHADPDRQAELVARYGEGLVHGAQQRALSWPRIEGLTQPLVEAAAIATGLLVSREQLWDHLDDDGQAAIVRYLLDVRDLPDPNGNWSWFEVMIETFLQVVTGESDLASTERRLDELIALFRDDGLSTDGRGDGVRRYDYYTSWALNFYPALWASHAHPRHRDRIETFAAQSARYVPVLLDMIGRDGLPIAHGRSLTYRAAVAAGLWAPSLYPPEHRPEVDPRAQPAATRMLQAFLRLGATRDGVLQPGWLGEYLPITAPYSGPGSPYWMSKAFAGLLLPPEAPEWASSDVALPIEGGDICRPVRSAGWLLHGTAADGIVRLHNHGADRLPAHRDPHSRRFLDDPMYARLAYTTSTAPLIDEVLTEDLGSEPALPDNMLTLEVAGRRMTLRSDVRPITTAPHAATSVWTLRGRDGHPVRVASSVQTHGATEIRAFRFEIDSPARAFVTGYAIPTGDTDLRSTIWPALGGGQPCTLPSGPTAFGANTALPAVVVELPPGEQVIAVGVELTRRAAPVAARPDVSWDGGVLTSKREGTSLSVTLPAPSDR